MDQRNADRVAGLAAIGAGLCWIVWALTNTLTQRGMEQSLSGSGAARLGGLLTAGWNLLLIPAALRLHQALKPLRPDVLPFLTGAGILSVSFWAFGGLTRITPSLETVYLTLAAVWLLGMAPILRVRHRCLAGFTLVVGGFTALDACFSLFEPMPYALYLLASPKLPLSALWSLSIGISLRAYPWSNHENPSS